MVDLGKQDFPVHFWTLELTVVRSFVPGNLTVDSRQGRESV